MKLHCDRAKLLEALLNVQRSVSPKSCLTALEGILMRSTISSVFLCGYDLEIGITTEVEAEVTRIGEVVLPAKIFVDIVRRLPEDTVHIEVDDKLTATIVSGTSEFSLIGISAQDYPDLPQIDQSSNIAINSSLLRSMVRQTIFAIADTDAKPIHTGTLFCLEDNEIRLVSVDGYRLALRKEPLQGGPSLQFVVPGKTLAEISRLIPDSDDLVDISVGKKHIIFRTASYSVISRLLEGEFLDYRTTIPQSHSTEIVVNTRALIDSVERVSIVITDRLKSPVRCRINQNTAKLSCVTTLGKANDEVPVLLGGDDLEIGFNNKYFLDALKNSDCDEVKIQMTGAVNPIKIIANGDSSFIFLVLPVRLKPYEND